MSGEAEEDKKPNDQAHINLKVKGQNWVMCFRSNVRFEGSVFYPLGISSDAHSCLNTAWDGVLAFLSPILDSNSSTKRDKSSARGVAAAIEDSSIDFGDFFKGPLPGKCLKLLGFLALSRLGIYIPLGGVNREAFAGNLDQNSLLSTLDSFSGGGIGRLGICSLEKRGAGKVCVPKQMVVDKDRLSIPCQLAKAGLKLPLGRNLLSVPM
ncbi:hypothetical protein K2173_002438 [Erythroxylum novogranatense]|uniref:Uncharacterized protein n=1 Tax=Erythroxylum novogranatense TaxID=1862640 RepID=A0AAV8TA23_9ROSI|nr:hypothetical protein K2173_002438 [Erythroxylum novogranatense]